MDKTKPVPKRVTMDGGIGFWGSLAGLALILALTILPLKAVGSEAEFPAAACPVTRWRSILTTKHRCKAAPSCT